MKRYVILYIISESKDKRTIMISSRIYIYITYKKYNIKYNNNTMVYIYITINDNQIYKK